MSISSETARSTGNRGFTLPEGPYSRKLMHLGTETKVLAQRMETTQDAERLSLIGNRMMSLAKDIEGLEQAPWNGGLQNG
jgi:hypothetical protein